MRVIIAGAGLVGLTAATALRRAGHEVVVAEQADEIRAAGASIGLWRNALDVLAGLGLGPDIAELSTPLSTWFYDAAGNPTRAAGYTEADHAYQLLPRPQLNALLAETVGRDNIRLTARVTGFAETDDAVTVLFADGSRATADLLIGADGVYSKVREQLVPGSAALPHQGHQSWRGTVAVAGDPGEGSVLTIGPDRIRGGYTRTYGGMVMWMVNQLDCPPLCGTAKEQALLRAARLNDNGWHDELIRLIESTPDQAILHNQIMRVPPLTRWTSGRVALIGDAAHGQSPHIAAGGTLGVEDVGVLAGALAGQDNLDQALKSYETERMPRYATVGEHALSVEYAADSVEYAERYAAFSHWMLSTAPTAAV